MIETKKYTRTLVRESTLHKEDIVQLKAWVRNRRDHGRIVFFDAEDRSGVLQCVVIPDHAQAYEVVGSLRVGDVVEIVGQTKKRPMSAVNEDSLGAYEMEVRELRIISSPLAELPIDISQPDMRLNLDTLLNYRMLTLRNAKVRSIFEVYDGLLEAYEVSMRRREFKEVKTPKILSNATEGGANFFTVKYFGRDAYLAQSPQFYKQSAVALFERVFEIGSVFRAEPHFTTRHVNEYIGLDAEMGFIDSVDDVMNELESVISEMMDYVTNRYSSQLALYNAETPGKVPFARMRLEEAVGILSREFNKHIENFDIDSEGERMIGEYIKQTQGSDFVFLTHYPIAIRPFYSLPSADGIWTETFDLIFRGVEIASGGQRIHNYQQLVDSIASRGLNPADFSSYLDMFRYGMPPHGGWGLGSERIIQLLLGLSSIKEAILYPRDVKRIAP